MSSSHQSQHGGGGSSSLLVDRPRTCPYPCPAFSAGAVIMLLGCCCWGQGRRAQKVLRLYRVCAVTCRFIRVVCVSCKAVCGVCIPVDQRVSCWWCGAHLRCYTVCRCSCPFNFAEQQHSTCCNQPQISWGCMHLRLGWLHIRASACVQPVCWHATRRASAKACVQQVVVASALCASVSIRMHIVSTAAAVHNRPLGVVLQQGGTRCV